jgi:hypothetical protein
VRWLHNSEEARVLSYERAATGESLVIAVNLSSQPWSGLVDVPAGEYEDITPENAQRTAALPGLFLAPWQFRIFRRQPR